MFFSKFFGNVNSNVKRNVAKIMAGVTAASAIMGFGMHQVYGGNETTLKDILGNLYPYGVVANELTISSDFESNFAVNVLYVAGHTTGNTVGSKTNVGGVMYAREIRSANEQYSEDEWARYGDLKLRSGNYLVTGEDFNRVNDGASQIDNQYYWWRNAAGNITVNDEMSKQLKIVNDSDYLNIIEEKKRVLSILNSFEIDAGKDEFTNGVIDVTDYRDGVVTVNYDITDGVNNNLTIKKNSGQLLIINAISEKNSANDSNIVAKYLLSVDGSEAQVTQDNTEANKVIWNFGIYKGNLTIGDNGGVFVAPNAKVSNCGTSSGYLIAGTFNNSSGEWHYINNELEEETTAESAASDIITEKETTTKSQATSSVTEIKTDGNIPVGDETTNETINETTNDITNETTTTGDENSDTKEEETSTEQIIDIGGNSPLGNETTTQQQTTIPDEAVTATDKLMGEDETTKAGDEITDPRETETSSEEMLPASNETTKPQDAINDPQETETSPEEIINIDGGLPLGNETTPENEESTPDEEATTEYDPDEELIQLDDLTPLGAPGTGDHSRIYVYVALAGLALGASILSVVLGKKKNNTVN